MHGVTRRRFLMGTACAALCNEGEPTLRAAAAARNITFGTEITADEITRFPEYADLVARECAIVTPGIEAKWAYAEPREGEFRFGPMDRIAAFAKRNGLRLHMHNLIWAVGLPQWTLRAIKEGREASVIAAHVRALVSRYAEGADSWDVINEPADPRWPSGPEGLCRTPWREGLGPTYIDAALHDAAQAGPGIRLLINDDDLEYDEPDRAQKRHIYLRLIEALRRADVPLHGFGLEAHLKPWRRIAEREYRDFLRELGQFGLRVYVTELDVCDRFLQAGIVARDRAVAQVARHYLDLVLDEPAVRTVITWGLSDRFTWMLRDPAGIRPDGLPPRPLPFDRDFAPKPMRNALLGAFNAARMRPA